MNKISIELERKYWNIIREALDEYKGIHLNNSYNPDRESAQESMMLMLRSEDIKQIITEGLKHERI